MDNIEALLDKPKVLVAFIWFDFVDKKCKHCLIQKEKDNKKGIVPRQKWITQRPLRTPQTFYFIPFGYFKRKRIKKRIIEESLR